MSEADGKSHRHDHADHDQGHDHGHVHGHGGHDHSHAHVPQGADAEKRILWVLGITFAFMIAEAAGGFISGSLALIADAGHMFTDVGALLLALAALRLGRRPGDAWRSFGYRRFEVLAAFTNGILLILLTIWIAVEAVIRFFEPEEVLSDVMLIVAILGLIANILSFRILMGGDRGNLNMRGAWLHVLGDMLGSIGAVGAALVIRFTGWTPIDPILSLALSLVIVRAAIALTRRSAHILLEGTPEHIKRDEVVGSLRRLPEVADAHHLHVWSIASDRHMATLHLVPAEGTPAPDAILAVKEHLKTHYRIAHATVELELADCPDEPGRAEPG